MLHVIALKYIDYGESKWLDWVKNMISEITLETIGIKNMGTTGYFFILLCITSINFIDCNSSACHCSKIYRLWRE